MCIRWLSLDDAGSCVKSLDDGGSCDFTQFAC